MRTLLLALVAGIAFIGAAQAGDLFPPGTVVLGQVAYAAQGDEAEHGFHFVPEAEDALAGIVSKAVDVEPANKLLAACGKEDKSQMSFALVRFYYFWNNEASGVIRDFSGWTMVDAGLSIAKGNIVEVQLRPGPSNSRCAGISRVRTEKMTTGDCEYRQNKKGAFEKGLALIDPYGGPGSASLYCPFLKTEGWQAKPFGPFAAVDGIVWSRPPTLSQPVVK